MPILVLFGAFFLYVYCEISLLVTVGSTIGVLPLLLLMILISMAGLWLIKLRGVMTVWQIRSQISEGKIPTQAVISSVFFAIAGVLLLIPGFLSDILAILLLLPITRHIIQKLFLNYVLSRIKLTTFGSFHSQQQNDTIFEAEFERQQDKDKWIK